MYFSDVVHVLDGLGNEGGPSYEGPPSNMRMVLQRAGAGGSTSKSGDTTSKPLHATSVLSFSLTQVLQLFVTS